MSVLTVYGSNGYGYNSSGPSSTAQSNPSAGQNNVKGTATMIAWWQWDLSSLGAGAVISLATAGFNVTSEDHTNPSTWYYGDCSAVGAGASGYMYIGGYTANPTLSASRVALYKGGNIVIRVENNLGATAGAIDYINIGNVASCYLQVTYNYAPTSSGAISSPTAGQVVAGGSVNLTTTGGSDPEGDALSYHWEYMSGAVGWTTIANTSSLTYVWNVAALASRTDYQVRVYAYDPSGSNTLGPGVTSAAFTIQNVVVKNVSDTIAISVAEARTIAATVDRTDTVAVGAGEARQIDATLSRTDDVSVSVAESRMILAALDRADNVGVAGADASGVAQTAYQDRADNVAVQATESPANVITAVSVTDTLVVAIDDGTAAPSFVSVAANDAVAVAVADQVSDLSVSLSRTDTLKIATADNPYQLTTVTSDSFDRADGVINATNTDAALGGTPMLWTSQAGNRVVANRIGRTGFAATGISKITMTDDQQFASALIAELPTAGGYISVFVRAGVGSASLTTPDIYKMRVTFAGVVSLRVSVGGVETPLYTSAAGIVGAGSRITLVAYNNVYTGFVDGVELFRVVDDTLGATAHPILGIQLAVPADATGKFDDFIAGTVVFDSSELVVGINRPDTIQVGVTDAVVAPMAVLLDRADDVSVSVQEDRAIFVGVARTDDLGVAAADQSAILVPRAGTDTFVIGIDEAFPVSLEGLTRADVTLVDMSEHSDIYKIYESGPPPDEILYAAIAPFTRVRRRVDIYESDGTTLFMPEAPFLDGNVNCDLGRQERRIFDLQLQNIEGALDFYPEGFWYDKIFKLYRGIETSSTLYMRQLGEFMVDSAEQPDFPLTVSISGRDYTSKLLTSKFARATAFAKNQPIENVIHTIASNGGITKFDLPLTGKSTGRDFFYDAQTERWKAIEEIAHAYDYDVYFTFDGKLTMTPYSDPTTDQPAYVFETGPTVGNMSKFTKKMSPARLYNHVVVTGGSSDTLPIVEEAINNIEGHPTSVDKIGDRTYFFTSSFITTHQQAKDVAVSFLKVHALEQFEVALESLVIPWLEPGQIVDFRDPNPAPDDPTRYLLSNFSIPMSLKTMASGLNRVTMVYQEEG